MVERHHFGELALAARGVLLLLGSTSQQERREALAAAQIRHRGMPRIGQPRAQAWKSAPCFRTRTAQSEVLEADLDEALDVHLLLSADEGDEDEDLDLDEEPVDRTLDPAAIRRLARMADGEIAVLQERLDSPYSWDVAEDHHDLHRHIEEYMTESRAWWRLEESTALVHVAVTPEDRRMFLGGDTVTGLFNLRPE